VGQKFGVENCVDFTYSVNIHPTDFQDKALFELEPDTFEVSFDMSRIAEPLAVQVRVDGG